MAIGASTTSETKRKLQHSSNIIYKALRLRAFIVFPYLMKKSILVFFLLWHFTSIFSQTSSYKPFAIVDSIDISHIRCTYHYFLNNKQTNEIHTMTLQIGNKSSAFKGYVAFQKDSLAWSLGNKAYDAKYILKLYAQLKHGTSNIDWRLFDNYPTGKTTITDRIFTNHFLSEEIRSFPQWAIAETEKKEILGYTCIKATTSLHGRYWTVWFAPDIAYPSGPWLLRGLPGLVLEASDKEKEHVFVCCKIVPKKEPVIIEKKHYFKAPREKVIQRKIEHYSDLNIANNRIMGKSPTKEKTPKASRPYNPIRRISKN